MNPTLRWIQDWNGVWTGTGETAQGDVVLVRTSFFALMEGVGTGAHN